jgi:ElaB/YqjD/DUF883 family membrane-anchored ribosome-binding protein
LRWSEVWAKLSQKETPMNDANRLETEKNQVRARLDNAIEKAKEVCERLQEQTTAAAKATDRTVREHPYQAIGVAFGLGIALGVLVSRCRD